MHLHVVEVFLGLNPSVDLLLELLVELLGIVDRFCFILLRGSQLLY